MSWFGRANPRLRAALIALAVVVVACAFSPSQSLPTRKLVVWVDTPAIGASIRQRIGPFVQAHPNLDVTVFDQFGKIQNGDVSIAIEALTSSELSPDVVALTDRDFRLMSNRDDLLNLSPYIIQQDDFATDDFFPAAFDAFRDRGKQYAIPSEVVPWVIFYNKQLFESAHVDEPALNWTVSDFIAAGQRVAAASSQKQQVVGFVADPTVAVLPFIETFGVAPDDAVDDPFARWLDDRRTADAVQWFADLGLREGLMPTEQGNRTLGFWYGGRAAMAGFFMDQRGQAPAFFQREANLTPTTTASPTPVAAWRFPWGVTMVPKAEVQTTVYYVSGYGIAQTSKDPDDAWQLIDFLTRNLPDQPGRAYVPARESLALSKKFADLYPETGREAYVQSVLVGHRLPALPPAANPTFEDLQGILSGSVHAANGLQAYRDRIQPLLNRPVPTPTPVGGAIGGGTQLP